MSRKATTFRIEPVTQAALEALSKTLKRPMNQLVNEAVKQYVARRSVEVERDLEETLERLRAYRELDPDFQRAIDRVAKAESEIGREDPAEGELVLGTLIDGRLRDEPGPVQAEIDQLLHG